ncbi:MAG: metallophosphoesterase family protein [Candidatus Wallbacteria bacterium]|nr:metallophosphoesterase family protein [Candidatus Wallbacteria bacterium]
MRLIVCSDLHANLEAMERFEQVIGKQSDSIACLGDFVGYNANPEEVLSKIRAWEKKGRLSIKIGGNHDLALFDQNLLNRFNSNARKAILWTKETLTKDSLSWLSQLQDFHVLDSEILFCHGSIRDPNEYILDEETALLNIIGMPEGVHTIFFGHTHVPVIYEMDAENIFKVHWMDFDCHFQLQKGHRYLINPGSIGQPRNNDTRLSFIIFDKEESSVDFCKLEYDYRPTQRKIIDAGLPQMLSERLKEGR